MSNVWKVLGGVVAGAGALAAAPITLPAAGIGIAAAAAATAAVGGIAYVVATSGESEKKLADAENDARRERARNNQRVQNMVDHLAEAEARMREAKEYFDLIVGLFAMAIGVAACDGEIALSEEQDIDEFIAGVSTGRLPNDIKERIGSLRASPPNLATAKELMCRVDSQSWNLADDVIGLVASSDGVMHPEEEVFIAAWQQFRAENA